MSKQYQQHNILGNELGICGTDPNTGFYRDGYCNTGDDDTGTHTVCGIMNDEFLEYTKGKGNDLSTPNSYFPGLKNDDKWCICALRYKQALKDGKAPMIIPSATNEKTLEYVTYEELMQSV